MAAVDATDWAIEGTVNDASLEEGRPERCGTPEGEDMLTGGMARAAVLLSVEGGVAVVVLGIVLVPAAALVAADLAGVGIDGLPEVGLAPTADFRTAGTGTAFAAGAGAFFGLALTTDGGALLAWVTAVLALVLAALAGVFAAVLAFAGMAFTS